VEKGQKLISKKGTQVIGTEELKGLIEEFVF